jgi:hypothetical protein
MLASKNNPQTLTPSGRRQYQQTPEKLLRHFGNHEPMILRHLKRRLNLFAPTHDAF